MACEEKCIKEKLSILKVIISDIEHGLDYGSPESIETFEDYLKRMFSDMRAVVNQKCPNCEDKKDGV